MIFKKELNGQTVYVALNLEDKDFDLNFNTNLNALVDVISGTPVQVNNGNAFIKMPAYSSMIIVADDIVNNTEPEIPETESVPEDKETEIVIGGKYRHYNGGEYEIISLARHSETLEELVIYKSLATGDIWARPKSIFTGKVGDVRRFTLI